MSATEFPTSWRDPRYVSTVVGVLATGALLAYAALVESALDPGTVGLVLLWVLVPTSLAYEAARRWL